MNKPLAFDSTPSARSVDDNGFMHVANSHITKATVNPYYGREIPGWREAGLDPEKIYYGLRDPRELQKSIGTWEGLPLHVEHHPDSADEPEIRTRVGAVGRAHWANPYIDASLTIWNQQAIDAIEDGSFRELSCAYRYTPDFTPGKYEGVDYDFVMRNIRGNHVALVEEGRAGADVLVADAALDRKKDDGETNETPANITRNAKPKTIGGDIMRKFKKFFRGATDANPDIERAEVDLAQSILDLHKVDPKTGEIVDITEDEDKAGEIRKIVGEISGKLDEEELKKLNDALQGLAYSKATGDEEPKKEEGGMDEEMKSAMDACGLDSNDEDMSKAFAAGVDYGEKLEKEPGERDKLNREHESNGLKSAMDACGLDAENPQESRAFAEGVNYGEKLMRDPEERKKLDREHESEGAKAAAQDEDKNAEIEKILSEVPDLTDAQKKKLNDALAGLAYSKATGDEDLPAQDRALRKRERGPRPLLASDAAIIQARAVAAAQDNMRRVAKAISEVRPLVGDLDMMAFDSASDVYGYTLEQCGVDKKQYDKAAWRGMVDMLRREKFGLADRHMAQDAKPVKLEGPFAGLAGISIGD